MRCCLHWCCLLRCCLHWCCLLICCHWCCLLLLPPLVLSANLLPPLVLSANLLPPLVLSATLLPHPLLPVSLKRLLPLSPYLPSSLSGPADVPQSCSIDPLLFYPLARSNVVAAGMPQHCGTKLPCLQICLSIVALSYLACRYASVLWH